MTKKKSRINSGSDILYVAEDKSRKSVLNDMKKNITDKNENTLKGQNKTSASFAECSENVDLSFPKQLKEEKPKDITNPLSLLSKKERKKINKDIAVQKQKLERKRKWNDDKVILSEELSNKIKTSYAEEDDENNALIFSSKKKKIKESEEVQNPIELLSKTKRKQLEKVVRVKQQKSSIAELYAELQAFNDLKPEQAIQTLKEDVKKQPIQIRKNLSEKIKTTKTRKLKSWQKLRNKNHIEKEKETSPDTSDFSTDEEEEEDENKMEVTEEPVSAEPQEIKEVIENSNLNDKTSEMEVEKHKVEKPQNNYMKPQEFSFILVDRPKEIQKSRLELPIIEEEASIMEAINENDVVILSGATGCGKTTQVPQFLYEAGYTKTGLKIGITEPRRVAAMAMCKRVSYELGTEGSDLVSYHIRYDKNATCSTQIKFMTDGILLQELKQDVLLNNYSVIIIDEAHERSVYSDLLIGLLSIVVRARRRDYEKSLSEANPKENGKKVYPLKLIIMSATLRVTDFSENVRLFPGVNRPPVISMPARQFPVDIHFNRKTDKKYLEEAFRKVVQIHRKEKEGGILVFVTGQQEVVTLCQWLKRAFPVTEKFLNRVQNTDADHHQTQDQPPIKEDNLIKVNLNDFSIIPMDEESEIHQTEGHVSDEDINDDDDNDDDLNEDDETGIDLQKIISGCSYANIDTNNPIHALPLYSLLPVEKQQLVFQDPPSGQRLVVVATNVAETSLTIPNIKYVVDTGMEKVKKWDPVTGISRFDIERISQSSAEQRTGRAGRVSHGKCFRLYSSAVFQEMKKFSDPEIVQRPIEDVVLMLKNYIHSSIPIHKFCLPTVPSETAIEKAEKVLIALGALRRPKFKSKTITEITDLGKRMSEIPLNPRFSRMLLMANQHGLLPYAVLMVSALSVPNFFTNGPLQTDDTEDNSLVRDFKRKFIKRKPDLLLGDITVLMGTMCLLEKLYFELKDDNQVKRIVESNGVRWQAFTEVRKLRKQLSDILNHNIPGLNLDINPQLPQPTGSQFEHLRQLVLSGSANNVAKITPPNFSSGTSAVQRRRDRGMYSSCSLQSPVFIHTQSVLYREKFEWVVFQDLYRSCFLGQTEPKPFMRNVTVIEPQWLPIFCTLECRAEGLMLNHYAEDTSQLPYYDENHDRIMACAKKILYGERNLPLPDGLRIPVVAGIMEDEAAQTEKLNRWFAKFFMDGTVFKKMESWHCKFKPSCKTDWLLNPIGNYRSEVKVILKDIGDLEIPCKKSVLDKWKENKNYLLNSYLEWILPDERESIISSWPPIDLK